MASSKKPTYKVEIKPINERKRRKSDLVIMWQSIWDLSLYILSKCWYISIRIWDTTNVWIKADEQQEIQTWLGKHLPIAPQDFSDSWRDGVLLSILLNKLQPGCYPDAENLDTDYGLRNVSRAFSILEARFNIVPKVSVEEIVTCSFGSDLKLQELLLQLKHETDNKFTDDTKTEEKTEQKDEQSLSAYDSRRCIAKGTGLLVGFVGREANFVVFYASMSELDLVIEIRGPSTSVCSERITKRSPKRKKSVKLWKPSLPNSISRSLSDSENSSIFEDPEVKSESGKRCIPVKYEIHANQINFSYTPLVKGHHRVSILCHGQHISDSPYAVTVEPVVGTYKNLCLKSVPKHSNTRQSSTDAETTKKEPVRLQEPESKTFAGKVIKRRVLRYIVQINKKDIEVDADGIDHLASALLKMDYELQKRPLSRRNSWGFVGDAERKVSMIRQFCVDLEELEAQSLKMHRSHSLTINKPKRPFPKSGSYECEDILVRNKLETVTEGKDLDSKDSLLQHYDSEEMLAYLNEEFDSKKQSSRGCEEMLSLENETNCDTETLKEPEYESTANSVLDMTRVNNSNQAPHRHAPEVSEKDLMEPQDSQTIKKSPDHLVLERELSEGFDFNSSDVISNPFINICHEQTQSNSHINHQNLEICLEKELITSPWFAIDKNEIDPHADIKDCTTKTQSLDINDNISEPKIHGSNESTLIEEKPFIKTDAKSLQSSYVYGEQISPRIIKSRTKGKKENNFRYFQNEVSKVFNFQANKNTILETEGYVKEKEELNLFKRKTCPRQYNNISSCIGTKKRKNNSDKIQKYRNKTSRSDPVLRNLEHFSLSNDTQDRNFKLENKKEKSMSDTYTYNRNILTQSPENSCTVSEQKFSEFERDSNNHTLLMNSQGKISESKARDSKFSENTMQTFRRLSDVSIKNNQIRNISENILSRVHSTPRKELHSSRLPWNLPSPINGQHSSKKTNINKINSLLDKATTNQHIEKPLKQPNVVHEISNVNQESPETNFSIQKRTLVSLGQFNFKHFNPAFQSNREGPVKARIKQWQNTKNEASSTVKILHKLETLPEKGNITEKLMFWENIQRKHNTVMSSEESSSECCEGLNAALKFKQTNKENGTVGIETSVPTLPCMKGTDDCTKLKAMHAVTKSKLKENLCSLNNDNSILWEKRNDDKLSIPLTATRIRKRSFSDPGDLEISRNTNGLELSEHFEILREPSREDMSSSTDVNYLELSADDEISSVDLLYSTEDEYIDDEISESASTYWGDLSFIKSLKLADSAVYREFCSLIESEYYKEDRRESLPSSPNECKVFGIANYFGHVAVKNRFRVLTNGAGCGNLSATVQGLGQHEVSFVSVEYVQKDVYEVTYQVLTPGLYLISVRWMENPISGSPFLCKVTF